MTVTSNLYDAVGCLRSFDVNLSTVTMKWARKFIENMVTLAFHSFANYGKMRAGPNEMRALFFFPSFRLSFFCFPRHLHTLLHFAPFLLLFLRSRPVIISPSSTTLSTSSPYRLSPGSSPPFPSSAFPPLAHLHPTSAHLPLFHIRHPPPPSTTTLFFCTSLVALFIFIFFCAPPFSAPLARLEDDTWWQILVSFKCSHPRTRTHTHTISHCSSIQHAWCHRQG